MVDSFVMFGVFVDIVIGVLVVFDVIVFDVDRVFGVDGKFLGSIILFFFNKFCSCLFFLVIVLSLVFRSLFFWVEFY